MSSLLLAHDHPDHLNVSKLSLHLGGVSSSFRPHWYYCKVTATKRPCTNEHLRACHEARKLCPNTSVKWQMDKDRIRSIYFLILCYSQGRPRLNLNLGHAKFVQMWSFHKERITQNVVVCKRIPHLDITTYIS
ncbi:hypothetical protein HRR83_001712 [Exophiala dermatitidis]|uniref:Uncharacterized protein n=1 Tax=Exophiala dermatitidis TaxID=5970 RepID=A0AAN6J202_EXODE|nr:hypothetical protein HRR73_004846 [Exophiala dermatitidis]KAJ4526518.1 hypothetical protein HRR74_001716 [Exophiala dermatitidis]KAJ4532235.1 hypothetical protein HRR76_007234 [Exophiala dermatitidis]KAJ4546271.1 hypothetical protein HRR77_004807 [Exophiala dermatitidis]KAJ4570492.1 hypothetical protein HRR81_005920 [Exophiala dermatitidis]